MSKYTKEILEPIVKNSFSLSQVITMLGLKKAGGNYTYIKKVIERLNLSTEHFTGQRHMIGKIPNTKRTESDFF